MFGMTSSPKSAEFTSEAVKCLPHKLKSRRSTRVGMMRGTLGKLKTRNGHVRTAADAATPPINVPRNFLLSIAAYPCLSDANPSYTT